MEIDHYHHGDNLTDLLCWHLQGFLRIWPFIFLNFFLQFIFICISNSICFYFLLKIYLNNSLSHSAHRVKIYSSVCSNNEDTWEGMNIWFPMFLLLPPHPWLSGADVTLGDDWMDRWLDGCKDILPGDRIKDVSSLFTLIAPQGSMLSITAVSWRMGSCACLEECEGTLIIPSPSSQKNAFRGGQTRGGFIAKKHTSDISIAFSQFVNEEKEHITSPVHVYAYFFYQILKYTYSVLWSWLSIYVISIKKRWIT